MYDGNGDAGSQRGPWAGRELLHIQEKTKLFVLLCCLAQLENWRFTICGVKACF